MHTKLKVKRLRPQALLPKKGSDGASGYDLYACVEEGTVTLERSGQPQRVMTGLAIEVPPGFEAQVRPRSGLSAQGVGVTFGTIDSDYRGELMVTLYLFGSQPSFTISHGDRIAQLVVTPVPEVLLEEVAELSPTERGDGGHGSTGMK
jgi:dUTP pyrophosphatase